MRFVETEAAARLTAKPKPPRSPQRWLKLAGGVLVAILFFLGTILFSPPALITLAALFYAAVPFICFSFYTAAEAGNGFVGLFSIPLLIAAIVSGFGSFFHVLRALIEWDSVLRATVGMMTWVPLHLFWSLFVIFSFAELFGLS